MSKLLRHILAKWVDFRRDTTSNQNNSNIFLRYFIEIQDRTPDNFWWRTPSNLSIYWPILLWLIFQPAESQCLWKLLCLNRQRQTHTATSSNRTHIKYATFTGLHWLLIDPQFASGKPFSQDMAGAGGSREGRK